MNSLCVECQGMCCKVLRIDAPTPDHVRWLEGRTLALGADEWGQFAFVSCRCKHLSNLGTCTIQERKPWFCKVHEPGGKMCADVLRKLKPELLAKFLACHSADSKAKSP